MNLNYFIFDRQFSQNEKKMHHFELSRSLNFMFLCLLIDELSTEEKSIKTG